MLYYLIASILTGASAFAARNERQIHLAGVAFYAVQAAFALWITLGGGYDTSSLGAFRFDAAGTLFFVLLTVGLANASFCRLFGGDWTAMSIVFTSTLVGFAAKQRMQAHGLNHFLTFIISSFLASLCASITIGLGSLWLGQGIHCPMTVLYIPALLPMVPGIYAYKTVFSLLMFLQSLDDTQQGLAYMQQFFLNATVSFSVIIMLAAGATLPIFIFNRRAFSLTRRKSDRI